MKVMKESQWSINIDINEIMTIVLLLMKMKILMA